MQNMLKMWQSVKMASPAPLHLLLMISAASAGSGYNNRYYGGSVTFTQKGQNLNGTCEVELRSKQTTNLCDQNYYECSSGQCGSEIQTSVTEIVLNSNGLKWCQLEVVTKRKLNGNLPFEIRFPTRNNSNHDQGFWVSNVRSSVAEWRMMAHVDLGTRSDTGESNRSPIVTMLPVLRVPKNCPRSFSMTVFDPDGDHIRCRVPTNSSRYECGLCGLTGGFSLDQNSCYLEYTYSGQSGYLPIELVVEDFPNKLINLIYSDGSSMSRQPLPVGGREGQIPALITTEETNTTDETNATNTKTPEQTSIPPLSSLPLQFSIYVDSYEAPTCFDGDYFPIFLAPTPSNGINLPAFVNRAFEIEVTSKALYTTIHDLIVTGPAGISKWKISTEEYVIKWTPSENESNDHFPICFVSEAIDKNGQIYQSELRCVIADVGHYETVVTCSDKTITVEVEKSYLIRRNEGNLHLRDFKDSSCDLRKRSNTTHLVAVVSLKMCGTIVEEDEDNIIFRNEITSANPNEIISRRHDVEISFSCVYPKRINLTLSYTHKNPYSFTEKSFGAFAYKFEFYESERFRKQTHSSTYPVKVKLKQMMFMQIEATTSIPDTELFVESCRATPYDNPNSHISYTIIEHGCVRDNTVTIYPSSKSQFRFGMEAFEFINDHEEVYITCSVMLCEIGVPGTRCSQGCIKSNSGMHRGKREAVGQTSSYIISQGPLHMVKTSDSPAFGLSLNLGLNIVFVVGCLLVCGVVIYRSRRSEAQYHQYQHLPTSNID